jgi:hypothetical protein
MLLQTTGSIILELEYVPQLLIVHALRYDTVND